MEWTPLRRVDDDPGFYANPQFESLRKRHGLEGPDEVWRNDRYEVSLRYLKALQPGLPQGRDGMIHLSIHRRDRKPVANWRHMQQMKNEVAGADRTAVEIYPPESALVDTSNEYHLWVLPVGANLPFGFTEGLVTADEEVREYNLSRIEGLHKGRQEPWEPGLTTGRNEDTPYFDEKTRETFDRMTGRKR